MPPKKKDELKPFEKLFEEKEDYWTFTSEVEEEKISKTNEWLLKFEKEITHNMKHDL